MDHTGSSYEGDRCNGRMEGKGVYTFASGTRYVGEMKDGEFHGEGTLHFPWGATFSAKWVHGKAIGNTPSAGAYTFKDGLKLEEGDWTYCDEDDRRFYSEHLNGVEPAGRSRKVDQGEPPAIPPGTYDTGDGFYDPQNNEVKSYDGTTVLRSPDEQEASWIITSCRVGL
eukprot:m.110224 g.110224  ORF g.110224 m.110224 type:complete len:169 (+) comp16030_c0_seq1:88-594(+)